MTMTLEGIKGRIGDLDSHESIPTPRYAEVFGEIGRRFSEENAELWRLGSAASIEDPENQITVDYEDTLEITQETVWTKKGVRAPGATNMDRRTAVMDEMGIQRQLIFPMMGILAWFQAQGGGQIWMPPQTKEQMELGKAAVNAYNDWAGRLTKKYSDRMWVVGILRSGDPDMTPELLITEAEALIASGCRAIMMSAGSPPAGLSPGDRKLDPFYELVAKANVSLGLLLYKIMRGREFYHRVPARRRRSIHRDTVVLLEPEHFFISSMRLATLTVSPTIVYSLRCADPMVPVIAMPTCFTTENASAPRSVVKPIFASSVSRKNCKDGSSRARIRSDSR